MNTSKLKKIRPLLLAVGIVLPIFAQGQTTTDTTFIYLRNGGVDAYPSLYAKVGKQTAEGLEVSWEDGTTIHYDNASIENISHKAPEKLPQLTMFKVNNKYNDQVFTDVVANINGDEVNLQIGCIGKWLTPSFQLSDDNAEAYVNFEKQTSKVSRHHFDKDIVYTVAMPEMRILRRHQLTEEIWIEGDTTIIPITLTTSQLSTNAPSNYDEGLDKMLDGDPTTFFHSTWGQGQYEKLPDNECPYIDIRLEEPGERGARRPATLCGDFRYGLPLGGQPFLGEADSRPCDGVEYAFAADLPEAKVKKPPRHAKMGRDIVHRKPSSGPALNEFLRVGDKEGGGRHNARGGPHYNLADRVCVREVASLSAAQKPPQLLRGVKAHALVVGPDA